MTCESQLGLGFLLGVLTSTVIGVIIMMMTRRKGDVPRKP